MGRPSDPRTWRAGVSVVVAASMIAVLPGCASLEPAAIGTSHAQLHSSGADAPIEELRFLDARSEASNSPTPAAGSSDEPGVRAGSGHGSLPVDSAPTMLLLADDPQAGGDVTQPPAPAPEGPVNDRERSSVKGSPDYDRRLDATVPVFWTGIVVGGAGVATLLSGIIAGSVYSNQLDEGYSTSMTRDEQAKLSKAGAASNDAALAGAIITALGLSMAAISGAIDWNRCGRLARKTARRRCGTLSAQ